MRTPTLKQAEADEDREALDRWFNHPLMRKGAPPIPGSGSKSPRSPRSPRDKKLNTKLLEDVTVRSKPPEPPPEPKQISEAELKKINKDLQRRERQFKQPKDDDDRGFSGSSKQKLDSDDEDEMKGAVCPLQLSPHDPAEWAGFTRLPPHSIPYKVMEQLERDGFPVGKARPPPKNRSATFWHPDAETASKKVPVLTSVTSKQYREFVECLNFLADNPAWPNVKRKQMYSHVARDTCTAYVSRFGGDSKEAGEIEAAAVLQVKSRPEGQVCWIHFIRMDNEIAAAAAAGSPSSAKRKRPIPAFMAALDTKLGPLWDKLVLQVHNENEHAFERFATKYGFERDAEYDAVKHHLVGMSKVPTGKAAEEARARRKAEKSNKRKS